MQFGKTPPLPRPRPSLKKSRAIRKTFMRLGYLLFIGSTLLCLAEAHSEPVLFSDTFQAGEHSDINSSLETRQSGDAAPITYRPLSVGVPYSAEEVKDNFSLRDGTLVIRAAGGAGRGPTSIGLDRNLSETNFKVLTVRVGHDHCQWFAIKLSQKSDGQWPDISSGMSLIVFFNGDWKLFDNPGSARAGGGVMVASGRINKAPEYEIEIEFMAEAGRKVSLYINGEQVIANQEVQDRTASYLVLQAHRMPGSNWGEARFGKLQLMGPK